MLSIPIDPIMLTFMESEGLGAYMRRTRKAKGLTQRDVAAAAGTSGAYWSQLESGKVTWPNAEMRRRIAIALGVRHVDLMIAAGELTMDEVNYQPPDDSTAVSAVRPILDSYDFSEEELRALTMHIRSAVDLIKGKY